jgi:hypothetical protein
MNSLPRLLKSPDWKHGPCGRILISLKDSRRNLKAVNQNSSKALRLQRPNTYEAPARQEVKESPLE